MCIRDSPLNSHWRRKKHPLYFLRLWLDSYRMNINTATASHNYYRFYHSSVACCVDGQFRTQCIFYCIVMNIFVCLSVCLSALITRKHHGRTSPFFVHVVCSSELTMVQWVKWVANFGWVIWVRGYKRWPVISSAMALVRFSCGGVAIRYVLPVLWTTSYFHTMVIRRVVCIPKHNSRDSNRIVLKHKYRKYSLQVAHRRRSLPSTVSLFSVKSATKI